jgi:[calcium/calmodulin-dependent protein kinase] kinase
MNGSVKGTIQTSGGVDKSSVRLKKLGLGIKSYNDKNRSYDSTLADLEFNKSAEKQWSGPIVNKAPLTNPPNIQQSTSTRPPPPRKPNDNQNVQQIQGPSGRGPPVSPSILALPNNAFNGTPGKIHSSSPRSQLTSPLVSQRKSAPSTPMGSTRDLRDKDQLNGTQVVDKNGRSIQNTPKRKPVPSPIANSIKADASYRNSDQSNGGILIPCSNEYNDAPMIAQFGDDSPNSSITKRPSIVPVLSFNTNPIPQPSPMGTIHKTNMQSIGPSGPSQRNPSPSPHGSIGPQGPQFQRLSQSITSSPNPNGNPKGRPIAPKPNSNSPHTVKETKDIKRNKAQLPSALTHAKPTTGNWLKKRYIVNNYILLDVLGTGSYGEVRLCKDRTTDNLFAVKIISKDLLKKKKAGNTSETYFEDIKREIAIMKKLLHPNVLRLYEVLDDPHVNKMYLVLEYMKKGDLINVLQERDTNNKDKKEKEEKNKFTPLPEAELWNIFRQVVSGIRYLHYQNIVHGDIKPQNLLVSEDGVVKIADFGISKMLHGSAQKLADAVGTPAFMAPELCKGGGVFSGQLADIWAIGATMFMLRFGHTPFVAGNILALYAKIQNDPLVFPTGSTPLDPGLKDLLEGMLTKDPFKRSTLVQVATHSWIRTPQHRPTTVAGGGVLGQNLSKNTGLFVPPASYHKDEADAMDKPTLDVSGDDMFMSIGGGRESVKKVKKKSNDDDDDDYDNDNDDDNDFDESGAVEEDDDNVMATRWGDDVFEMIDDADSDDEDEDEDGDESIDGSVDKKEGKSKDKKGYDSTIKNGKDDDNRSVGSLVSKGEMSKDEEERRSLQFKKRIIKNKEEPAPTNPLPNSTNNGGADIGGVPISRKSNPSPTPTKEKGGGTSEKEEINELTMDDFASLMDTLGGQQKIKSDKAAANDAEKEGPLILTLPQTYSALLRNTLTGIGAAFHSEQGTRNSQEDRCILLPDVTVMRALQGHNFQPGVFAQLNLFSLAGIFDGHNGWRCSQYLSQNLAPRLVLHDGFCTDSKDKQKGLEAALIDVFHTLDEEVCEFLQKEDDHSGSTAVVAVYDGRRHILTVASTGDSMCVLSRGGRAVKHNRMHRFNEEDECKRVKASGGSIVNNRLNGLLAVSRSFGDIPFKEKGISRSKMALIATPEVISEVITPMTEFAIIATDGLWDIISPQEAVNFIRKNLLKKQDLQEAARSLCKEAISKGSVDNVTVLVVSFWLTPPPINNGSNT